MRTSAHGILAGLGLIVSALATSPLLAQDAAEPAQPAVRPNFVLVLVDDAAFMDFGIYGGEARTPVIDRLARRGMIFSNYHSSPLCAPSRAMLLTGLDNHRTGLATIPEVLPPEHRGQPGYGMSLEPGVVTVADRLQAAGYRTYMTGKWHLGHGEGDLPNAHGFDHSFVLDASGADNWDEKPYMPYYRTADWFEDGARAHLPDEFYSSEFLVDRMIDYIDADAGSADPFFAYLAFQAIHIPVQAPREFTENYAETYRDGWEALRQARASRAVDLGLVPATTSALPLPDRMRAWTDLSEDDRALYARSMAVNAGMLEAMDHHLGRLVEHLESTGQFDNTIFIVTSDNGPEPSHPVGEPGFGTWMNLHGYTRQLENLGERGSYAFIGPEWAMAAAAPFNLFKFYASEGGLRVPFLIAGPGIVSGQHSQAAGYVTDVTPTILDLAGLSSVTSDVTGRSLRSVVTGRADAAYAPGDAVGFEVSGNSALFRGDFKLVRNMPPWGDGSWQLFDLAIDPGETFDLAAQEPDLTAAMLDDYAAYAAANGVLDLPEGYDVHDQISINATMRQLEFYGWQLALVVLLILGLAGFGLYRLVRFSRRR
ncbi:arylsulfatase [uncultured Maricaulis sp.]|uniref:arylsulfatase n=1 Tax=uncultured Maricaulis sp. TaxID=174710 RepID=UPI0030DCEF92|tara:strand:- start:37405 stop:39192 length:1788 start_codon:yes stop_codon:yes gene_type:complete